MSFSVAMTDDSGKTCTQTVSVTVVANPLCIDWSTMAFGAPIFMNVGGGTSSETITPPNTIQLQGVVPPACPGCEGKIRVPWSVNWDGTLCKIKFLIHWEDNAGAPIPNYYNLIVTGWLNLLIDGNTPNGDYVQLLTVNNAGVPAVLAGTVEVGQRDFGNSIGRTTFALQ